MLTRAFSRASLRRQSMRDGPARLEAVLSEHKPEVVQFFAPAVIGDNVKRAQASGAKVMAQVGCERDAVEALRAGADTIIAQGKEAGGHGLRAPFGSSTLPLAARIVRLAEEETLGDERKVTVLAAGGIDVRSARALARERAPGQRQGQVWQGGRQACAASTVKPR